MLDTDLKDYKEFFIDHFRKGISIRQYAANKNINSNIVDFVYDVIIERMNPVKAFDILWEKIE